MAGVSRFVQYGSIFSRISGLLRTGAISEADKPIWYEVYQRFPPIDEPRQDKVVEQVPVRNIFYPEDIIRAKFYQTYPGALSGVLDMQDEHSISVADRFVHMFLEYHHSGEFKSELAAWEAAAETLQLIKPSLHSEHAQSEDISMLPEGVSGEMQHIPQYYYSESDVGQMGEVMAGGGAEALQTGSIVDMYEKALAQEQEPQANATSTHHRDGQDSNTTGSKT